MAVHSVLPEDDEHIADIALKHERGEELSVADVTFLLRCLGREPKARGSACDKCDGVGKTWREVKGFFPVTCTRCFGHGRLSE